MKKLAMHKGTDVRIVTVEKETPKFYVIDGEKFKKVDEPTPDRVALSWGSGFWRGYVLSEIDSDLIQKKLLDEKRKSNTRSVLTKIKMKFRADSWVESSNSYFTLEQVKHLNEYLDLGLEIEE